MYYQHYSCFDQHSLFANDGNMNVGVIDWYALDSNREEIPLLN